MHLNQYNKITRDDIVELCRCTPNHASWLLRQLVKDNVIQLYGAWRGAFYKKGAVAKQMSNLWSSSSFFMLENRKASSEEPAIHGIISYDE